MGRDIFSMIWYGRAHFADHRRSVHAAVHSHRHSVRHGQRLRAGLAGPSPDAADRNSAERAPNPAARRAAAGILGTANVLTLSLVIGLTSWASIAKVVRTEVRRLRSSEYVLASRCMGGGFFHVLRQHLAPNFFSSISFMVVMNIRSAITAESTLSFLGIGLPIEVVSWGSMLSLSEKALLTDAWWIIVIPGVFMWQRCCASRSWPTPCAARPANARYKTELGPSAAAGGPNRFIFVPGRAAQWPAPPLPARRAFCSCRSRYRPPCR